MANFRQSAMPDNKAFASTDFEDELHNKFLIEILLNNTDNSIILTDKAFKIIFFNKLASEWSVLFTETSLRKGMSLLELSSPENIEAQSKLFNAMLEGDFYETETELKRTGRDYACFQSSFQPAKNNNGEIVGILITSKNITERKKKEEELRISNERYQLISQATSDAIWDYDVIHQQIYFNESYTKYFGHEVPKVEQGFDLWEMHIHPADKDRVVKKLDEAIRSNASYWEDEYRFMTSEGEVAYV